VKVAVVQNRKNQGVINRLGQPSPEKYAISHVQRVVDALREGGHTVAAYEGDTTLPANLEQFMPPDAGSGLPAGMVFNMAYGIQGQCRYTHVPAMLEMAGVPYTGASPFGHVLSQDKVISKILMRDAGIPTPAFRVASHRWDIEMPHPAVEGMRGCHTRPPRGGPDCDPGDLRFPLVVKPRHESTSYGLQLVRNREELTDAVRAVLTDYEQDALVEEYIEGREICVGLLGNDSSVELLPLVELDFEGRQLQLLTWDDKYHKRPDEPKKRCPVHLPHHLEEQLQRIALAVFRVCHCKDYARVDLRIDCRGNPQVLEINSMTSLGPRASYVLAATRAGYSFHSLVCRILDVAHRRYFGVPAPCQASDAQQTAGRAPNTAKAAALAQQASAATRLYEQH
jgi:D-alanine-D-alanine ligase